MNNPIKYAETITVSEEDLREVIEWWRSANEAPGGCSAHDAIKGMKDAIWRLELTRREQGGIPS